MKSKRVAFLIVLALVAVVTGVLFWAYPRTAPQAPTAFVPADWSVARKSPMHAAHVDKQKIECTKCHKNGFQESPGTTDCGSCHEANAKRSHLGNKANPTTCLTCHVFAAGASPKPCAECHTSGTPGPKGQPLASHTVDRATCTSCHGLHGEPRLHVDTQSTCTSCHAEVRATHGQLQIAASDAGTTDSGPSVRGSHDSGVDGSASAKAIAMCTSCHAPHAAKGAASATCAGCHSTKKARPHEACVTCHEPHLATVAATKSCPSCHTAKRPSAGHTSCTSCHAPHSGARASGTCASCHQGVKALAAATVPAHDACGNCHEPHTTTRTGAASPSASLACAKCHANVHPSHPTLKGGACTSCHTPHPKTPQIATTCSSCHTKARDDRAFHASAGVHASPAKGVVCTSCHRPHQFVLSGPAGGPTLCAQCHATEAKIARTGHSACASCHGATHTPSPKPGCRGCHAAEANSAHAGHSACTSCHDAHSGSLAKVTAATSTPNTGRANATCPTCHAAKSRTLHGTLPGAGCATCHRAHGPQGVATPPSCTSCHTPAKLPGLHAVGAHASKCASCHTAHAPPHADRATCTTSCHENRRTHQPEATLCTGCHVFRR